MKLRGFFLIMALPILGLILGCNKEDSEPGLPVSLDELKASDSFNWTTGHDVQFQFEGIPTQVPVRSALRVSLSNGTVLFSSYHAMDQNLDILLPVPSNETYLFMTYGSKVYALVIQDGKARFSFIPSSN